MTWSGRRVLVTGAAGFIGSHLVEECVRAGASVRAFVRYNSRNDYGWLEVADPSLLAEVEIFTGDLGESRSRARCDARPRRRPPPRSVDPDPVLVPTPP